MNLHDFRFCFRLKHFYKCIFPVICFLLFSCSSDEEDGNIFSEDSFLNGAQEDADLSLLYKFWSIYEVNFESRTAPVPNDFPTCDRNFFTFKDDGVFEEFLITNSECVPQQQSLNWSFDDGVVNFRNSFNDADQWVIIKLTQQEFVFRIKFDFDEDGEEEIYQFLARPYSPDERKFYENTLQFDDDITDKISLTWSEYDGINSFERYEVLLSTDNCNINNAKILASISDKEIISFEDLNPPNAEQLCYFLKVYTNDGLLFQSTAASISTEFIDVPGTELSIPEVNGNSITLNWEKYRGLYFSNYELVVKNYVDGFANLYQEEVVAIIDDIEQTTFTHNEPPLIKNPVYEIRVNNVFGKQNFYNSQEVITARESIYKPERVIDILDIRRFLSVPDESVTYFFGAVASVQDMRLMRFNYETKSVEALSTFEFNFGQIKDMKLISSNGTKELFFLGNNRLLVFNAQTLEYKYDLEHNEVRAIDDFIYLGNNIFALINDEYVYTIERDFANTDLIDTQLHFPDIQHTNNYLYHILQISNNRIMIGNANEAESFVFNYDAQGNLSNKQLINIPITSTYTRETVFNTADNTIINFNENRIHSLVDFSVDSFEQPYFSKALISSGTKIIGSNNNPEWQISAESQHEKRAVIYDINSSNLEQIITEGYPHFYFENASGELFILSTYFKRDAPTSSFDRSDFFIEKVN